MNITISDQTFPLISATGATEMLGGTRRDVITLKLEATYAQVNNLFVDGATFSIEDSEITEYDNHGVAGPITDNRDGTMTIKMGKNNTAEQDALLAKQKAEEKVITIAGKSIANEKEAESLRAIIETAFDSLSDEQAAGVPFLSKPWKVGESVSVGDRRYYSSKLYKCRQAHTTQADWTPDTTPALWAVVDVAHAGTIDDPIPASAGMEYEYGKYYFDATDGNTYLCARTGEAAGGKIILQYLPHELVGQYFTLA